jgi:hypothetical protein
MKNRTLPPLDEIVGRRIDAGIAGAAEFELWMKNEIFEDEYSEEFKQKQYDELLSGKKPIKRKIQQPKHPVTCLRCGTKRKRMSALNPRYCEHCF